MSEAFSHTESVIIKNERVAFKSYDTVIVGAGCAGLAAADHLYRSGQKSIAMLTDYAGGGTSRNTGSDKQTYYKLTLCGDDQDSVRLMAETLYSGGCMDGYHAMAEAAMSVSCFSRLCDLGVPFPQNKYGEYVGYKTDHDPMRRATSVGPLTSHQMTIALEASVKEKSIAMFSGRQAIKVLTEDGAAKGVVCLLLKEGKPEIEVYLCNHLVFATGGPAGIYQDSSYPRGHTGSSGMLFEAGAKGKNLTEWQYGLASIHPRWNVSGTYMQVLPRFVSTDINGQDAREFLADYLPDVGKLLDLVFLKGYQWPFDIRKVNGGSSLIDLIVYTETKLKGRRVFLDFLHNPFGDSFSFDKLGEESYNYLQNAGALFGTPIERLAHMNKPAIDFYQSKGVDLHQEMLEIALCSQHQNGGVDVDRWWQSGLQGLFVVGEAAGTHGVYRPGGSALNAGQVGARRAATYISVQSKALPDIKHEGDALKAQVEQVLEVLQIPLYPHSNLQAIRDTYRKRMSSAGAAIRNPEEIDKLLKEVQSLLTDYEQTVHIASSAEWSKWFRCRDMLYTQQVVLTAMSDYSKEISRSRGSVLYTDPNGTKPLEALPDMFRYTSALPEDMDKVQECWMDNNSVMVNWRSTAPLPNEDYVFETIWREYRENKSVM